MVFTLTKPGGGVVTQTSTTGAGAAATFTYSFNRKKDPAGTYRVGASASANGLSASGTTSFLVTK